MALAASLSACTLLAGQGMLSVSGRDVSVHNTIGRTLEKASLAVTGDADWQPEAGCTLAAAELHIWSCPLGDVAAGETREVRGKAGLVKGATLVYLLDGKQQVPVIR